MKPELKRTIEGMLGPDFMGPVKLKDAHAPAPAPAPAPVPGNAPVIPALAGQLLDSLKQGDSLALGELPRVLQHCTSTAIANFRKEALPVIAGMGPDLEASARAMIAESYSRARQHEMELAMYQRGLGRRGFLSPGIEHHMAMIEDTRRSLQLHSSKLGQHKGENRVARHVDNDPVSCAAKGLKPFTIEGVEVWAGTEKAAWKKYHKLNAQGG